MQSPNTFLLAETRSDRFSESDDPSPVSEVSTLDEIRALIAGRDTTAFRRIRDRLWENFGSAQRVFNKCAEKVEAEEEEADADRSLFLTSKLTEALERQARIFESLSLIKDSTVSAIRRAEQTQPGNSVPRSSRRHKPPVIVDAELT